MGVNAFPFEEAGLLTGGRTLSCKTTWALERLILPQWSASKLAAGAELFGSSIPLSQSTSLAKRKSKAKGFLKQLPKQMF